jgi:hypothetical protein
MKKNKQPQLKELFIEGLGKVTGGKKPPIATTLAIGEEDPVATTLAVGEEDWASTDALGEETPLPVD